MAFVVLVAVIFESSGKFANVPLMWIGFVLGIVFGAYAGHGAIYMVHGLALALFGLRNEELLIKYHDLARSLSDRREYMFGDDDVS